MLDAPSAAIVAHHVVPAVSKTDAQWPPPLDLVWWPPRSADGLSYRLIAGNVGMSKNTVMDIVRRGVGR